MACVTDADLAGMQLQAALQPTSSPPERVNTALPAFWVFAYVPQKKNKLLQMD